MKVIHENTGARKLVAVTGSINGLFLPNGTASIYLGECGDVINYHRNLEGLLSEDCTRKPVYEGDKIILQF